MSAAVTKAGSLLVVEDDPDFAASLESILQSAGYEVRLLDDGAAAAKLAGEGGFDAVLTDFRLPGMGGLNVLDSFRAARVLRPVILMTAHSHADLAIEATKRGAFDFLIKPFDVDELLATMAKAVHAGRLRNGSVRMSEGHDDPGAKNGVTPMLGRSRVMQQIFKDIGRIAPSNASVLILGETGTGKELVARALWQHSRRGEGPFIAVNCGALPQGLLESELFGHVRGAFTGAVTNRVGRFEQADGGTLFLDEIGDLPMALQVKLLRVLQDGAVQPLGSSRELTVDVRVIVATNQPLERLIAEQRFREDLFYRVNGAVIRLPPLRERREDIPILVRLFVGLASADLGQASPDVSPELLDFLGSQPWPGNVRQLQQAIRRAVIFSNGYPLTPDLVEKALEGAAGFGTGGLAEGGGETLDDLVAAALDRAHKSGEGRAYEELVSGVERKLISMALRRSGGHLGQVAGWLGISRVTLRKKMSELGL
ncbi:MAG: sigma-54-dependent transcriptional regulator [Verrucomicrobiales bacterium]